MATWYVVRPSPDVRPYCPACNRAITDAALIDTEAQAAAFYHVRCALAAALRPAVASGSELEVLPMELTVGDLIATPEGVFVVVDDPAMRKGGAVVRVRVRRTGRLAYDQDVTWAAHQRVTIRRPRVA